ncbi:GSCOCG00000236001-RA-CDS [Cotesia congregata]|nr:GSCOCG00000236001-RA-CDS [Cotesia congregata]
MKIIYQHEKKKKNKNTLCGNMIAFHYSGRLVLRKGEIHS